MNKNRIYIAGPMRGRPDHNFPRFDTMELRLKDAGWTPINPANLNRALGFDSTDEVTSDDLRSLILQDLNVLFGCQAIFMLDGWMNSNGATLEHALAKFLGLDIYYEYPVEHALDPIGMTQTGDKQINT